MTTKINFNQIKGAPANILDYGASTSDTTGAVNRAAIQAAQDASTNVYIPAGTFIINAAISPTSGRTFFGDGGHVSIIKAVNNFAAVGGFYNLFYSNGTASQLTFQGIGFDENRAGQSAPASNTWGSLYLLDGCDDLVIKNCVFKNKYTGSYITCNAINALIDGNQFLNTGIDTGGALQTNPIQINNGAKGVICTNNYFDSTTDYMIGVENECYDVLIANNVFRQTYTTVGNGAIGSFGLTGSNINRVMICDNVIDVSASTGYAMRIQPGAASGINGLTIQDNVIYASAVNNGADAILIGPPAASPFTTGSYKHITIKGNTIIGSATNTSTTAHAIQFTNPAHTTGGASATDDLILYTTIEDNIFKQYEGEAIILSDLFDVTIRNNQFWFCGNTASTLASIRSNTSAGYGKMRQYTIENNFSKGAVNVNFVWLGVTVPATTTDVIIRGNSHQVPAGLIIPAADQTAWAATFAAGRNYIGESMIAGFLITSPLLNTPASAAATGVIGEMRWDTGYLYVCTAANTWKRVAIATW